MERGRRDRQVYPGDCTDPGCPHGLFNQITVLKKKFPHLKFLLSVGGWTDSGPFYEMAADEAKRRTFVESCASFLQTYPQFDGIDIDWEHPVAGGLSPASPATRATTCCCWRSFAARSARRSC